MHACRFPAILAAAALISAAAPAAVAGAARPNAVAPGITVNDTTPVVDGLFVVTGTHFHLKDVVVVQVTGQQGDAKNNATATVHSDGRFSASLTTGLRGAHTVVAKDESTGAAASASIYVINLAFKIGNKTVHAGSRLAVSGQYFAANSVIHLSLSGLSIEQDGEGTVGKCPNQPTGQCIFKINTNSKGSFDTTIVVPPGAAGDMELLAYDPTQHAYATPAYFEATVVPLRVHVSDSTPARGQKITITGGQGYPHDRFGIRTEHHAYFATTTSSATGRYTFTWTVPANAGAAPVLEVVDLDTLQIGNAKLKVHS